MSIRNNVLRFGGGAAVAGLFAAGFFAVQGGNADAAVTYQGVRCSTPVHAQWHRVGTNELVPNASARTAVWTFATRALRWQERRDGHPLGPCGVFLVLPQQSFVLNSAGRVVDKS